MKISTLVLSALLPFAFTDDCLNEDFDHDPLNISPADSRRALNTVRARDLTTVDLYLSVIISKGVPEGEDWGKDFDKQVAFLNEHYKPWGYHFDLKFTTYMISADWAKDIDVDKEAKMHALHRGDYQTLNVYLVEGAKSGVCSFPDGSGDPIKQDKLDFDGCFVPLGAGRSPTSGTLAHEIGHWFGLMHTFQGGCTGNGDYCDDTNPQSGPSRAKLATSGDLDSCPAPDQCGKGPANIKNFVSPSHDQYMLVG